MNKLGPDLDLTMKPDLNKFNSVASFYEEVRPTYPRELYLTILNHKTNHIKNRILEIGAGPGNSTTELLDYFDSSLTVLEPNDCFLKIISERFKHNKNISILQKTFEDTNFDDSYFDLIFAATTFQWLDPIIKYKIAHRILAPDGILVVYWNNYLVRNRELKSRLKDIFDENDSSIEMVNGSGRSIGEKIERRKNEISNSSLFKIDEHALFQTIASYTSDQFCKLIRTFADQSINHDSEEFMYKIKSTIIDFGDNVDIEVTTNLEIASKTLF